VARNFVHRMQVLEAGMEWQELVETEAVEIADTVERLGMDLVRLDMNAAPDYERPKRIGEFSWREGETIVRFIPGSPWVERRPIHDTTPAPEEQEQALIRTLEGDLPRPAPPHDDCFHVNRRARESMRERGLDPMIFVSVYALPVCTLPPHVFTWFYDRPELVHRYYEMHSRWALTLIRKHAELGADIIGLGGDLASDGGPLISPAQYRKFVLPHLREQAALCHSLGVRCTVASDGDLWSLLDMLLLDSGVDGFEEIDAAAGMDLRRLKRRYGQRSTFIGNMDIRWLLTSASPEEVARATVDCIEAGWGDGGHVLMSSNCIHEGIRPANFAAVVEAYRSYFGVEGLPPPLAVSHLKLPGYSIPS
jgi:hypothetical protein